MGDDDRFEDLGRGSTADRLAELDEREPEPVEDEPAPRRPGGRYAWIVGIVFLVAIVVAGINTLPNEGRGLRGPEPGELLPAFAAPLATGRLEGDANVKQDADDPGRTLACEVRGPDVLNICDLREDPVVLGFMFTRAADCEPQLDRMERVRRELPEVRFAAVAIREPRKKVAKLVRERGWGFPVGVDRDGQVSNFYGIGGCPTTVFAYAGGRVRKTELGNMSVAELRSEARALLRRGRGGGTAGEGAGR